MAQHKVEVPITAVNNGLDFSILTGISPIYPYENGKRTSDTPIGTKFEVLLPGNRLSPLTVKIEGVVNPLPKISDEELEASCVNLDLIAVRFKDCKVSLYSINGNMVMSAVAKSVELAN